MNEELKVTFEKITEYFKARQIAPLRELLRETEEADIAIYMEEELSEKERLQFFRLLPKELASDVFVEFESDTQETLIKLFTDKELKEVIQDMFLDDTVDIIDEMPANVVKRILKNSSPEDRKLINELLEYPDDSAGSLMTPEFVSLSAKMTVQEAFDKIRVQGVNKETIYTCYVTNVKKQLIGVVTVKDLLLAPSKEIIENIMETSFVSIETLCDKEEVAHMFSKYGYLAFPVLDKEGCIVGIITVDDAVEVIQEEATEDIEKMAAISMGSDKPYLKTSTFKLWLSRIPWLMLLMISATFTGIIMNNYESVLSSVLVACVPMLMGTSGNAGGQSSVTVIRSMSLKELDGHDFLKVIWKEIRVGVYCALCLGVICFAKLMLLDNFVFGYDYTLITSLVVSISLSLAVIMAKLVGAILPFLAKGLKLDPAVVASPFITTIVDALSLMLYCGIAIALL